MTDFSKFGESENKNFRVIDTIPVPHPYCITPKHLSRNRIYLDADAIREAESNGAKCDICKHQYNKGLIPKILSFDEHKKALLIECDIEIKDNSELKDYLLKIKDDTEKDGFVGFAFIKSKKLREQNIV